MATDKSEPKVGVIAQVSIVSIVTLVLVHAALVAYFDRASYDEEMRKIGTAPPEALMSVRASEKERLSSGPMPIDKAMEALEKGRMTASPAIMPSSSRDIAPLQGWTKLPSVVPSAMMAPSAVSSSETGAAPAPSGSVVSGTPAASAAPSAPSAATKNPPSGAPSGGSPPKNP